LVVFPVIPRNDAGILDENFFYNASQAYELIGNYSANERWQYVLTVMTVDLIYPLVYALLLSSLSILPIQKLSISSKRIIRFAYISFAAAIFDVLENSSITILMLNYPVKFNSIATLAGCFTAAKWLLVVMSILFILYLYSLVFIQKYIRR
jgi:hypothetical protein